VPAASGYKRMANLSAAEHAGIVRAFSDLYHQVEVLVVDTAAGLHDSVMTFSQAAQHVLVVVCDEPASITDAYALIKVLSREHGVQRFQILANQTRKSGEGPALFEKIKRVCDRFLNVTLEFAGSVPFDDYLRRACSANPRSWMRTPHQFHPWRSRIWPRRPISGQRHKGHGVTWSSL
jgi:flagellar biosynthesis protein FlhG